jgi:hypothetical protein
MEDMQATVWFAAENGFAGAGRAWRARVRAAASYGHDAVVRPVWIDADRGGDLPGGVLERLNGSTETGLAVRADPPAGPCQHRRDHGEQLNAHSIKYDIPRPTSSR